MHLFDVCFLQKITSSLISSKFCNLFWEPSQTNGFSAQLLKITRVPSSKTLTGNLIKIHYCNDTYCIILSYWHQEAMHPLRLREGSKASPRPKGGPWTNRTSTFEGMAWAGSLSTRLLKHIQTYWSIQRMAQWPIDTHLSRKNIIRYNQHIGLLVSFRYKHCETSNQCDVHGEGSVVIFQG